MSPAAAYGVPDPLDQAAYASPSPSNPFNPSPATSGVNTGGGVTRADPGTPPSDFKRWATSILEQRIGSSRYALIPRSQKDALIAKIWQDSSVQANYAIMASNPSAAGALITEIGSVLMGQGDDPTVISDYVDLKTLAGVGLTTAEQAALAGATQAIGAPVPKPFGNNVVSGYDFGAPMPTGGWSSKAPGQSYGWLTHNGVDYGTRAGDRIVSPFAGTAHVQTGVAGYGNYVTITLDNGWKMGFGHVASGSVQDGARVNPGDLIAIAGANVGSAQGSVTIVTWQSPQDVANCATGRCTYQNPHNVLDPIFHGTTFGGIGAGGAAGTGIPTVNKLLDAEYPTIKTDWQTYFGTPPSPEDVYNVLAHGNNPAQWSDYIRALPGHIDGMNVGQAYDLRQTADQVSMKVLGHLSTDGIVKDLFDQKSTSPQAVTNWYNLHGVTGAEPETYKAATAASAPVYKNIFNETGADPRDIQKIIDRGARGGGGYT